MVDFPRADWRATESQVSDAGAGAGTRHADLPRGDKLNKNRLLSEEGGVHDRDGRGGIA